MAKAFKPHVHINGDVLVFKTYAEVKKNLKRLLEESNTKQINVSRHRRGQWGEWYETWGFNHARKPVIIEETWM